jgi:hypothetical protein
MTDGEKLEKLLREVLPWYRGIGVSSPRFYAYLKSRKACDDVCRILASVSLTGQIGLKDGILFSEREIIKRNEFVDGRFIVIGSCRDYSPIVLDPRSGAIGLMQNCVVSDHVFRKKNFVLIAESFAEFLIDNIMREVISQSEYLVPVFFDTDASSVIERLVDCGHGELGEVVTTSRLFRDFLANVGIDRSLVFNDVMPIREIAAGTCGLFTYQDIMKCNPASRRQMNPRFIVIGGCLDGGFVVLYLRDNVASPEVGYVAFAEVGDEGPWLPHYVKVSPSLGCFLHDSNFLGTLPYDYYQALELGYMA